MHERLAAANQRGMERDDRHGQKARDPGPATHRSQPPSHRTRTNSRSSGSPHVLIIDDVNYLTYSHDTANVVCEVLTQRHQVLRSMIFTLNRWGQSPARRTPLLPPSWTVCSSAVDG